MNINILEVHKQAKQHPGIFENDMYDSIHDVCNMLFNERSITANERGTIVIKDRITLELSFSWNENKVYVYTYILPGDIDSDEGYEVRRINPTFRLFGLEEVVNYLQIKKEENEFIKNNEG